MKSCCFLEQQVLFSTYKQNLSSKEKTHYTDLMMKLQFSISTLKKSQTEMKKPQKALLISPFR